MLSQDEIDNLLSSLAVAQPAAPTGAAAAPTGGIPAGQAGAGGAVSNSLNDILNAEKQKNYKLYNFRRPDKFSKDHLRALQSIHENFGRQFGLLMTSYLRMGVEIDVVSVDQLTYNEFVRSMPRPMTVSIMEFAPLPGQLLFGVSFEVTVSMIDRMLGGPGECKIKARELTDVEGSLMKRVLERCSQCLEDAWRSMMNVQVMTVGLEENYSMIQVVSPGEIVALVTFEVTLGNRDSGLMSLCIPYPVLEGVMESLSSQHIFQKRNSQEETFNDQILKKLNFANIPASVVLGGTQITLSELMDLSVGDVVKLDRPASGDLLLCVNEKPKFFCKPGTLKDKLAVVITESSSEVDVFKGFALEDPSLQRQETPDFEEIKKTESAIPTWAQQ